MLMKRIDELDYELIKLRTLIQNVCKHERVRHKYRDGGNNEVYVCLICNRLFYGTCELPWYAKELRSTQETWWDYVDPARKSKPKKKWWEFWKWLGWGDYD